MTFWGWAGEHYLLFTFLAFMVLVVVEQFTVNLMNMIAKSKGEKQ